MFTPKFLSRFAPLASPAADPLPAGDSSWDALEHLLRELKESQERVADSLHALLRAVRTGVRADLVFLVDARGGDVLDIEGGQDVPPQWCLDLAARLLAEVRGQGNRFL